MGAEFSEYTDERLSVLQDEIAALNQGEPCETEIVSNSKTETGDRCFESPSFNHVKRCKKPHDGYIDVKKLNLDHLPLPVRKVQVLNYVKGQASRCVKLTVKQSSPDRPTRFKLGRAGSSHVGSGDVFGDVSPATVPKDNQPEHCFLVTTAAHVVFNNNEVKETSVRFFFDNDDTNTDVLTGKGVKLVGVDEERDTCQFICEVADRHTADIIKQRLGTIPPYPQDVTSEWTFCVSHPHGLSQKVSFGLVTDVDDCKLGSHFNFTKVLFNKCGYLHVCEKKVLFYRFSEYLDGRLSDMDDSRKLFYKQRVLKKLSEKSFITEPNPREWEQIEQEERLLRNNLTTKTVESYKKKYGTRTVVTVKEKELWIKMWKEILESEASKIHVSGCEERYMAVRVEYNKTLAEIDHGVDMSDVQISHLGPMTYSLCTCPGSSGAKVHAFKPCTDGITWSLGQHSRAGKLGNMSGGGRSVLLRKESQSHTDHGKSWDQNRKRKQSHTKQNKCCVLL